MRGILKNWHRYLLWLTVSFFLWAWIITLITDAPAGKKVVLFADVPAMDREGLSAALEAELPEGIRFVETRLFTDDLFSPADILKGDLFIVSAKQAEGFLPGFLPLDPGFSDRPLYASEGKVYGVCVFDEAAGIQTATPFVAYVPGETYFLFFNADSRHLGAWNGSADRAAVRVAQTLLSLP